MRNTSLTGQLTPIRTKADQQYPLRGDLHVGYLLSVRVHWAWPSLTSSTCCMAGWTEVPAVQGCAGGFCQVGVSTRHSQRQLDSHEGPQLTSSFQIGVVLPACLLLRAFLTECAPEPLLPLCSRAHHGASRVSGWGFGFPYESQPG